MTPKQIIEYIVVEVIDDITIKWDYVKYALEATLANPIEIAIAKKAFYYLAGDDGEV